MILFTARGYFWLHGQTIPDNWLGPETGSVPGTLSIDDEGRIDLDLDGILSGEGNPPSQAIPAAPIQGILKTTQDDNKSWGNKPHVLLLGVYLNGSNFRSNGITYEKYFAEKCISSNICLGPSLDILFTDLSLDLDGYEEWLMVKLIDVTAPDTTTVAIYTPRDPDVYAIDGGRLRMEYGCRRPMQRYRLHWEQFAKLTYTPSVPVGLDDILVAYQACQDLLILLTDGHHGLEWPDMITSNAVQCRFYFHRNRNLDRSMHYGMYPVGFSSVRDNFGDVWSDWIRVRNDLGPGAYLYLGTRKGVALYPENRFVNLIWGIESLHRKVVGDQPTPQAPVHAKVKRILERINDARDKKWLERQLQNATEPTLAERIYQVFQCLPLRIEEVKLRDFSERCAKRRNDISHYGGQRHDGNYDEFVKGLIKESEALSILYHAYLLHRIGVGDKILAHWIHAGPLSFHKKRVLVANGLLEPEQDEAPIS